MREGAKDRKISFPSEKTASCCRREQVQCLDSSARRDRVSHLTRRAASIWSVKTDESVQKRN